VLILLHFVETTQHHLLALSKISRSRSLASARSVIEGGSRSMRPGNLNV
jgi:hypothetical protein